MQVSGFNLTDPEAERLIGKYKWNIRAGLNEAVLQDMNRKPVCFIHDNKLDFYLHHAEGFEYRPDSLQTAMSFVEYVFSTYSIDELDKKLDCREYVDGSIHVCHKTIKEIFNKENIL